MRRSAWVAVIIAAVIFTVVVQVAIVHTRANDRALAPTHTAISTATATAQATATPTLTPVPTSLASDFITRVIARTNEHRQAFAPDCVPLTYNAQLTQSAYLHSEDMAIHGVLQHNGTDGSTVPQRIAAAGYHYSTWAENVGWSALGTPETVVDTLFNETPPDDGHRRNMLSCSLHEIGVGVYYTATPTGPYQFHYYWTQDFGTA